MGLSPSSLNWFMRYLSGRDQITDFQGHLSKALPVTLGIPQGSVLGPLLFLQTTSKRLVQSICSYTPVVLKLFSSMTPYYEGHFFGHLLGRYYERGELYIAIHSKIETLNSTIYKVLYMVGESLASKVKLCFVNLFSSIIQVVRLAAQQKIPLDSAVQPLAR